MTYRVLSCDGGGVRGLMTAVWLSRFEQKLGGRLRDHFDLVAGTSTGSILACAVSHGIPAEDIVAMYQKHGREVFPPLTDRFLGRIQRTLSEGVSAPKYDGRGLEAVLQRVFGTTPFGDLEVQPTLVVSYDTFNRQALVFKNTRDLYASLPVWEIVRASCAAPVYFPGHVMKIGRAEVPLIDGGVVANNPTACAVAEAVRWNWESHGPNGPSIDDLVVASFGTGQTTRQIGIPEVRGWGGVEWVLPVIDVIFDGVAGSVDYVANQLLCDGNYFRFQCKLERAYDAMDNAAPENLNALISTAEAYLLKEGEAKIDQLVRMLKGHSEPVRSMPSILPPAPRSTQQLNTPRSAATAASAASTPALSIAPPTVEAQPIAASPRPAPADHPWSPSTGPSAAETLAPVELPEEFVGSPAVTTRSVRTSPAQPEEPATPAKLGDRPAPRGGELMKLAFRKFRSDKAA